MKKQTIVGLTKVEIASYLLAGAALFVVLLKGLLVALLCGLLAYSLVHSISPLLGAKIHSQTAKYITVAFLSVFIVSALIVGTWVIVDFLKSDAGNVQFLIQKLADVLDQARRDMPQWAVTYLPRSAEELRISIVGNLRENAAIAKNLGTQLGMVLIQGILGLVIGALIALVQSTSGGICVQPPLATALKERANNLYVTFRSIVFAQVRISAINATITAVFLLVVLPLFGVHLPFSKTLVVIAFLVGIMPIVGNTISNTILVIIGLSHSLPVALAAFGFMFAVHKLEYFLNAKIMGGFISAKAWELLLAMLVMEAIFGIPGVVAAPIFYGYLKKELRLLKLV